jgi:hypothetical protein
MADTLLQIWPVVSAAGTVINPACVVSTGDAAHSFGTESWCMYVALHVTSGHGMSSDVCQHTLCQWLDHCVQWTTAGALPVCTTHASMRVVTGTVQT